MIQKINNHQISWHIWKTNLKFGVPLKDWPTETEAAIESFSKWIQIEFELVSNLAELKWLITRMLLLNVIKVKAKHTSSSDSWSYACVLLFDLIITMEIEPGFLREQLVPI